MLPTSQKNCAKFLTAAIFENMSWDPLKGFFLHKFSKKSTNLKERKKERNRKRKRKSEFAKF
jgi:hypothetical protein